MRQGILQFLPTHWLATAAGGFGRRLLTLVAQDCPT